MGKLCDLHIFAYSRIFFAYFSSLTYCVFCRGMVNGECPARAGQTTSDVFVCHVSQIPLLCDLLFFPYGKSRLPCT